MKRALLFILFFGIAASFGQHSKEFYVKGAHVTIENGAKLHIQGDFHLDQGVSAEKGRFNNDGLLEIRGNFYIMNDNVEQTSTIPALLSGSSTGTVRFKNRGFTNETTHQGESQSIIVSSPASSATGAKAFYDLELENNNNTSSLVTDNFVDLNGGDVSIKSQLKFNIDCRFRTNSFTPTPSTGENYSYKLTVTNSAVNAIVGASVIPGDDKRYIEGNLARGVAGTGDYYFPVGLAAGFAGSDGMAAFELSTSGATAQRINAYVSVNVTDLAVPQIYCDIGDYPDAGSGTQPWSACTGGPDGLYDFAHLNVAASHEWSIENTLSDFTYDLEFFPGPGLDATVPSYGGICGSPFHLRFVAKDGALMDGAGIGDIIDAPLPFGSSSFPIGYDLCPPQTKQEGNTLSAQTSFSRFRLHGANDIETALPIELVNLEATPIDNSYIEIFWTTASEINNYGFELERSLDGIEFEPIAWVNGHGTTLEPQSYRFDDHDVIKGVIYYYRLKQIDFDGTYERSYIVNARLDPEGNDMVLYPNPVLDIDPVLEIFALHDFNADVLIMNAIGQEVKREILQFSTGYNRVEVPTADIAAGTYIVNVLWDDRQFSDKMIILRNK